MFYIANTKMPNEKAFSIHMVKMCEAFSKNGAKVTFVVPITRKRIKDDPYDYYGIKRIFDIERVPSIDLVGIVPRFGYWLQYLSFVCFVTLRFLFMPRKHALIYTREFLIAYVFKTLRFKTVYESHRILLKKRLYFWFLKDIKWIITNSIGVAEEFKNRGYKQVLSYPNGVTLENFTFSSSKNELREKLHLPLDRSLIMYTGNLYSWKGIDTVIETAKTMKQTRALFMIVGGTDADVKSYRQKIANKNIINVLLLGHQNIKDIPKYLKAADVLILPNVPTSEESIKYTSPMKLFDYMASGVPIVASDLPSIREILDETNALLVSPGSHERLREGIEKVLNNPALSANIAGEARKKVSQFTWDKRAEAILNFIKYE